MGRAREGAANAAPLVRAQELWLMASAALTVAPHVAHAPLWLSIATSLALIWRAALWWRRWPLPPRWLLTVLVLAGLAGVFATYRQLFGKDPGVALLTLFLALKLMELRGVRDAFAALFLCYFLLLTHFLYSQSIATAGATLAALIVITAALASLTFAKCPLVANLRLSGLMLAQATPFMLVLFLLFPRVQGPLWGLPVDANSGLTGLSDTMAPGSISALSLSGAVAFRAKFEGDPPPQQALYWRGPVLGHFDGRAWRVGARPGQTQLPYRTFESGFSYSVTLEPHNKTWLFALEMPVSLPRDAAISADYQVLTRAPIRNRIRYELRSVPGLVAGADEPTASVQANLLLPRGNPRTLALATRWRKESPDPQALVRRALAHFRQEPFIYTLTPPLLGQDSMDEFLFETRRGFCEHYASAFVVLMRAAGVPARIVTGYQGGERNPVDGYVVVRQSDAHAWAEVWIEGKGWMRVDPTAAIAPTRIEGGLVSALPAGEPVPFLMRSDLTWLRSLRFNWEAWTNAWNQWVLGYNVQRQQEVLSRLGMREPDWRSMTAVLAALCGALMLGLTAWALRQHTRLDAAVATWDRLSRRLATIGLARLPWEGPLDYAGRVARARPELENPMKHLATLYIGLRYGNNSGAEPLREMKRLIAGLNIRPRP